MKVKIGSHIKAIAWDLDGTVINSFKIMKLIVGEMAASKNLPVPTHDMFVQNFHGTLRETLHNLFGGTMSDVELDEYFDLFLTTQQKHYESVAEHLIEDAMSLMERANAAGYKQILATNRIHEKHGTGSPHSIVASSVLKDHIHEVVAGDTYEYRKPDPRVLDDFLKKYDLQPHEVLVIGDQFVDAQLALNLGTTGIVVNRDGFELVGFEQLPSGWEEHVTIVPTLHEVELSSI